ncbi:MAG: beta-ketoacyl-ACP synthase II, partial [Desulfovibrionaceae bacterium]
MHRVVITATAAITPLGNDAATSWQNLLARKSGIGPITRFDATDFETRIAGEVKGFDPVAFIPAKQARRMEPFCQYAVAAAEMLLAEAGWRPEGAERETTGVIIGVGLGGLDGIEHYHKILLDRGPSRLSPFFIPVIIANMAAGQVSIFTGAGGPNVCTTTACASGTHALGYAFTEIMLGRVDAVICGGCESTITPLAVAGFNALKALSTRNDDPEHASRPFDLGRDGFIIGEGCGLLLMESLEHAEKRGARILAEVAGFGASGDAYHMTAPPEDGAGMSRAMRAALRDAKIAPEQLTHINAHGTSTTLNDLCESRAIKDVFGEHAYRMPICSNKSQIGHLLGGAGGVEGVFTTLSIANSTVPSTVNLET